jgi:hypothetical protein
MQCLKKKTEFYYRFFFVSKTSENDFFLLSFSPIENKIFFYLQIIQKKKKIRKDFENGFWYPHWLWNVLLCVPSAR